MQRIEPLPLLVWEHASINQTVRAPALLGVGVIESDGRVLLCTGWAGRVSWIRWYLSRDLREAREVVMQTDVGRTFQAPDTAGPECSRRERACLGGRG